ncbi:alpha/beta fold hydrolase [Sanguibacter sp. Leaf3]|uniref:alpha/beta fold hydrolase n=1 Tax=Sanguibacter sp. Leaf3 TaxID=1736209 RepID=UPI0006FFE066|nr:alpha/beta hydrolase [Sanguibacter sp. Leaf3]KQT99449.1 esterase [Sanguibacter sp. Leaf3]
MTDHASLPHTHPVHPVHVVLVPGFWLGGWAWDDVVPHLQADGLTPHAVTLPGLDDVATDRSGITHDDHVRAVLDAVAPLEGEVVLVGHSGAGAVVHEVVDRDPSRIRRVVYVDSGPLVDGASLRPGLPEETVELPLPTWEELAAEGSSVDGIDEAGLAQFRARAVPHPAGVATGTVHLTDPARLDVPVTVICTSLPSEMLRQMATPGPPFHTELGSLQATYVDLPTGHWPMFSKPAELAREIATAARTDIRPALEKA